MKKMRMKVLALCFSMTLTVSALAGNGRLTIQAATSQESSGTKKPQKRQHNECGYGRNKIRSSKLPMKRHLKNFTELSV